LGTIAGARQTLDYLDGIRLMTARRRMETRSVEMAFSLLTQSFNIQQQQQQQQQQHYLSKGLPLPFDQ
jgi:hypothetical protein